MQFYLYLFIILIKALLKASPFLWWCFLKCFELTFEFKIKLVVLGAIGYGHGYIFVYNSSTGVWVGDTEPNTMKLIWNDFEIKYYHHGGAADQANASDAIYFYIGLG